MLVQNPHRIVRRPNVTSRQISHCTTDCIPINLVFQENFPEVFRKNDLLSDHFDGKQSRESVDLPLTCHPSLSLTSFAFRSSEVRRLLLDLDTYRGSDPLGMFSLFLKRTADVLAPRLSVVFRRLVRLGSSRLAGDRPMSPLFQRVHRPLLPTTDRFS